MSSDGESAGSLPSRIVLAAGGTGGHIYPAIAFAEALKKADPMIDIQFYCGNRPQEIAIYSAAGIDPVVVPLSGRRAGLLNQLRFAREFVSAWRATRRAVERFRPDLAVGFGGYLSVPVLMAARRRGARTALHEQNATPGLANRWLARRADLIMTGLPLDGAPFGAKRTRLVGNPVRECFTRPIDRGAARGEFGLPSASRVCFCFGGSQGAVGVNRLLMSVLESSNAGDESGLGRWHFLWATGPAHLESIRNWLDERPELSRRVTLEPYIDRMELAYGAADVVISRAGAIAIAEIAAMSKPAILIPLPTSAGGHQQANAEALARSGAAEVVDQAEPGAAEKIAKALVQLTENADRLRAMAEAARSFARLDAAHAMVEAVRSSAAPP